MSRVEVRAALLLLAAGAVSCGVVRYDQSQTGDYNVHLDLKNVDFLAFLDDSSSSIGEGQYDYDYGELTLKPPAAVNTPANSSSSEAPLLSSTEKTESSSGAGGGADSLDQTATTTSAATTKPARRCGAGFYRDPAGRCRRQRRPGGLKLTGLLNQAKNKITG